MVLLHQQRVHQFAQQPAGARIDAAHDAEVEEHDAALIVDIQVAGVQVAVEQAVPQAALEEAEQQGLDQLGAVESGLADGGDVIDADALHPLHRQHLLGGVVPVHLRHPDVFAQWRRVQVRDPGVHRLRLEAEVQLLGQVVAEVGDHVLGGQPAAQLGQLHGLGEALEDLQIGGHPAADARPLDLDHDLLAAVQGGVVHLGDRRRRERLLVEAGEQLRRIAAELLGEQLVHLACVCRRHPVEQAAEFPGQLFAEGARAGRDDLPEFDVGGAQVGEGLRELPDDLLLHRTLGRQLGEDAGGSAGELPTRHAEAGRLDRQRNPVKLGYLAVVVGTHRCSVSNRCWQVPIPVSPLTGWALWQSSR